MWEEGAGAKLLLYACEEGWEFGEITGIDVSHVTLHSIPIFFLTRPACSVESLGFTYSRILAWRILWTEGVAGLQSMVSQRAGHD